MNLTSKLYDTTRKALIGATALAFMPAYSDARPRTMRKAPQTIERYVQESNQTQITTNNPSEEKTPSYLEFKVLLEKKGKYDQKKEGDLEKYWQSLRTDTLKSKTYLREKDPTAYIEKVYGKKGKEQFESLKLSQEDKEKMKKVFSKHPWKFNPNDPSDLATFYDFTKAIEAFSPSF